MHNGAKYGNPLAHLNMATLRSPTIPSHTKPSPSPFSPSSINTLKSGTRTLFSWTWKLNKKKAMDDVNSASGSSGAVDGSAEAGDEVVRVDGADGHRRR